MRRLNGDLSEHRGELPKAFPPRYYALKLLEGDRQIEEMLHGAPHYASWIAIRDREARRINEVVASLCGFSGANYLCRVFKKETGQTPAQWRAAAARTAMADLTADEKTREQEMFI